MRTIFVTGGAGFIGSAFIHLILETTTDVEIVDFDALTYAGNPENLKGLDPARHRFVKGDICDKAAVLDALPDGAEAVFNFAAESHVDRSISSAGEFVLTNVLGTQVLLDAARAKKVKRFVQISTDEVMGSLPDDSNLYFTELSPLKPNSPYAASKAAAEHFVRAARETFGLDTVITRCGNNYGPRQFPEKLIPLMILSAMADKPLPVYGDGQQVRDWIYVADHCAGIDAALRRGQPGEVYNFGGRAECRNLQMVHSILALLHKPQSLIRFVADRPGHDRRYAIDCQKAEQQLGWQARWTLADGLVETVRWYRENPAWCQSVQSGEYRTFFERNYADRLVTAKEVA